MLRLGIHVRSRTVLHSERHSKEGTSSSFIAFRQGLNDLKVSTALGRVQVIVLAFMRSRLNMYR